MDKKIVVVLILAIVAIIGGMYLNTSNLLVNNEATNWGFPNEWDDKVEKIEKPKEKLLLKETKPQKQLQTNNYEEALEMSKEHKMPIMMMFTADWCSWCEKMKNETFTNSEVKGKLKNYIYCEIDTDHNKSVSRKFKVKSLPSCAIIEEGEMSKFSPGFKNSDDFLNWLK